MPRRSRSRRVMRGDEEDPELEVPMRRGRRSSRRSTRAGRKTCRAGRKSTRAGRRQLCCP